jgi:hypothetical protein
MKGKLGGFSSRKMAERCASTWLTPIKGNPMAKAADFAKERPTNSDPTKPGPWVTAMPSMSLRVTPAVFNASATMGTMDSICFLDANSGTTPPYF